MCATLLHLPKHRTVYACNTTALAGVPIISNIMVDVATHTLGSKQHVRAMMILKRDQAPDQPGNAMLTGEE